ncbi:MAG: divalent-cation tolerance protein CutA [Methylophilaceae bacterium]
MVNTHFILCHTTVKTHKQAKKLATRIIQRKLGACVQIKPVESIYAWEKKIAHEEEFQLVIKTQSSLKKSLMNFIKQEHDYSLPEIIFVPIIDGEPDYLDWVHANSGEP